MKNTIPGFMAQVELETLESLFSRYNDENAAGVEVGSLFGRSSYQIAQAINKGTLYCIDLWSGFKINSQFTHEENVKKNYPLNGSVCTLEAFLNNTSECKNIIPIKGMSPKIVGDWSQKIDFVFLDGSHTNPGDWYNIEFWLPKIKPGGILSGHDYRLERPNEYPDIIANVQRLEKELNQKVKNPTHTSIWYFEV